MVENVVGIEPITDTAFREVPDGVWKGCYYLLTPRCVQCHNRLSPLLADCLAKRIPVSKLMKNLNN